MNVFLSYRRDDSQYTTDRIYEWLVRARGRGDVFKDVNSIPLGRNFHQTIHEAVGRCDVLLAVIGPGWLTAAKAPGMRRLDDPDDFVRMEIEAAIERDIPIIPLLVNNATIPTGEDLPPSLRPLTYRNGMPVRPDPDFRHDMERLIAALPKARSPLRRWLLGGAVVAALTLLLTILAIRQRAAVISNDGPANPSPSEPSSPLKKEKAEPKQLIAPPVPNTLPRDAAELERRKAEKEAKAVMSQQVNAPPPGTEPNTPRRDAAGLEPKAEGEEAKAVMPPVPKQEPDTVLIRGHTNDVMAVTFSSDCQVLATGGYDKSIRLWDVVSHKRVALLRHTHPVFALAFSHDGKTLASGDSTGKIVFWDVASRTKANAIETKTRAVMVLAFSPDGKTLAALPWTRENIVQFWDIETGKVRAPLKGHAKQINNVVFAPDGTFLATASDDETVRLWDPGTGEERDSLKGHGPVHGLASSPDSRQLASGGYEDKTVTVWDVASGNRIATLEGPAGVRFVGYARDGKTLLSMDNGTQVTVWFLPQRKEWYQFKWRESVPDGYSLYDPINDPPIIFSSRNAFASDGSAFAVGFGNGDVGLWHLPSTNEPSRRPQGK